MFLGVDGGGSGTALALVDAEGTVRAQVTVPSAYYFATGIELVEQVLARGVQEVCAAAGTTPSDVQHAFFGLPGYGESSADVPALDAAPRAAPPDASSREATMTPARASPRPAYWTSVGRSPVAIPTTTGTTAAVAEIGATTPMLPTASPR